MRYSKITRRLRQNSSGSGFDSLQTGETLQRYNVVSGKIWKHVFRFPSSGRGYGNNIVTNLFTFKFTKRFQFPSNGRGDFNPSYNQEDRISGILFRFPSNGIRDHNLPLWTGLSSRDGSFDSLLTGWRISTLLTCSMKARFTCFDSLLTG